MMSEYDGKLLFFWQLLRSFAFIVFICYPISLLSSILYNMFRLFFIFFLGYFAPWFIWDAFVWKLSISKLGKLCLPSWFNLFLSPFNWVSVTIWDIKLLFYVETCRRATEFLPLGDRIRDDSRTWFFSWFKYTFCKLILFGLYLCCLFCEFCLIKVCSELIWDPNGDDFAKERCCW